MKKWTLILLLSLGVNQTSIAATTTSPQKPTKPSATKKTNSHKIKHAAAHKKPAKSKGKKTTHTKLAHANGNKQLIDNLQIPQAKFDLDFSRNTENITAFDQKNYSADPLDTSSKNLTALAYQTVESVRFSQYKLGGTTFNLAQGIYRIDCSAYINDLLSKANPQAFSNLVHHTQTTRPTTSDYYHFFQHLPEKENQYWRKIMSIEQLGPGGILVFLNKTFHNKRLGSGHVMVVMSKPIQHNIDTYQVQVADSASSGHSFDTRLPHKSGIGIGTLLLKVDPYTKQPKAYAWRLGGHWRSNIAFAMAKPLWTHLD